MIRLSETFFARAAEKARTVKPKVVHIGAWYGVCRSDGGIAVVRFSTRADQPGIWASCSCPAHTKRCPPLPCYHIAAAVLFGRASAPAPAPASPPPAAPPASAGGARPHEHHCPNCGDVYPCDEPPCDGIWRLPCGVCDLAEADAIGWRAYC